jgi:hypothetical protein
VLFLYGFTTTIWQTPGKNCWRDHLEGETIMNIRRATSVGGLVTGIFTAAVLAFGGPAYAQGPVSVSQLSFNDNGLTLTASGVVNLPGFPDGLGILVDLTASADVTATCTNPHGNITRPPRQQPMVFTTGPAEDFFVLVGETGSFNLTTPAPLDTTIAGAPGCPSHRWAETIADLAFTQAIIDVFNGDIHLLTLTCTFSEPTSNGPVPAGNVSCTSL